jgi:hypothetical protein
VISQALAAHRSWGTSARARFTRNSQSPWADMTQELRAYSSNTRTFRQSLDTAAAAGPAAGGHCACPERAGAWTGSKSVSGLASSHGSVGAQPPPLQGSCLCPGSLASPRNAGEVDFHAGGLRRVAGQARSMRTLRSLLRSLPASRNLRRAWGSPWAWGLWLRVPLTPGLNQTCRLRGCAGASSAWRARPKPPGLAVRVPSAAFFMLAKSGHFGGLCRLSSLVSLTSIEKFVFRKCFAPCCKDE